MRQWAQEAVSVERGWPGRSEQQEKERLAKKSIAAAAAMLRTCQRTFAV